MTANENAGTCLAPALSYFYVMSKGSVTTLAKRAASLIYADAYPDGPGSKGSDGTSQAAANAIVPNVAGLRFTALRALEYLGSATALECVAFTGVAREALQPRISELRKLGLVEPTGERKQNPSLKWAAVLRLTDLGRAVVGGGA